MIKYCNQYSYLLTLMVYIARYICTQCMYIYPYANSYTYTRYYCTVCTPTGESPRSRTCGTGTMVRTLARHKSPLQKNSDFWIGKRLLRGQRCMESWFSIMLLYIYKCPNTNFTKKRPYRKNNFGSIIMLYYSK